VHDIRIAGRNTQGVIIFKLGDGEKVASVAHLPESGPSEAGEGTAEDGDAGDIAGDTPE
jgi:DNA gyrase subunit A